MAGKWTLYIDAKEPKASKELAEELRSYNMNTEVSDMAVGDYWMVKDGKIYCSVERKKMADLLASIPDGRYTDQTARMLKSEIPHLFFLVIGSIEALDGPDKQRVNSAMLHLQMHRNIKVAYLDHEGHVKPFFVKMHQYLCEDPSIDRITAPLIEHVQANCRKKKLDTHKDVFTAQLMCVHGVSEAKANCIANMYDDFPTLIKTYESLPDEQQRISLLKDVPCGKQKLGPVLSERIYRCIMNKDGDELSVRTAKRKATATNKRKKTETTATVEQPAKFGKTLDFDDYSFE
jgi:ERCC4-type nuclease